MLGYLKGLVGAAILAVLGYIGLVFLPPDRTYIANNIGAATKSEIEAIRGEINGLKGELSKTDRPQVGLEEISLRIKSLIESGEIVVPSGREPAMDALIARIVKIEREIKELSNSSSNLRDDGQANRTENAVSHASIATHSGDSLIENDSFIINFDQIKEWPNLSRHIGVYFKVQNKLASEIQFCMSYDNFQATSDSGRDMRTREQYQSVVLAGAGKTGRNCYEILPHTAIVASIPLSISRDDRAIQFLRYQYDATQKIELRNVAFR